MTASARDGSNGFSGTAPASRLPIRVITTGSRPITSEVGAGPASFTATARQM